MCEGFTIGELLLLGAFGVSITAVGLFIKHKFFTKKQVPVENKTK